MNSRPFALEIRQTARAALPEAAFLRRDRGEALFVTNAPRLRPGTDWTDALARAGFSAREEGGLLYISPAAPWIDRLEAAHPQPPDFFSASVARFSRRPPEDSAMRLFAMGLRLLDGGPDDGAFDRKLRQRAAEALRTSRGGGLYACAILRFYTREVSL